MVEVHHFRVWNVNLGDWIIPPSKRTAEDIAAVKGIIIEGTMENVPASSLDREGRWDPDKPLKTRAKTRRIEPALRPKMILYDELDDALDKSFPASDPVSLGHSDHVGQPKSVRKKGPKLPKGLAGLKRIND